VEVREASGIDQADISRLEGRESLDDFQVSTLQRYVAGARRASGCRRRLWRQEDHSHGRAKGVGRTASQRGSATAPTVSALG